MSKLFKRSVQQRTAATVLFNEPDAVREASVKTAITQRLGVAVKCLQQLHIDTYEPIYSGEDADNVCHFLEAIFIHGLKDTFFEKMSAILKTNPDRSPEPNFWPLLLIFTHKDILSQINNLSQLNSDVGRCRAWIRVALNDGLLESYLAAMIQDKSTMEYYYKRTAYLRDSEHPDILRKYIEGLTVFQFKLACNSHMLNIWSVTPLIMAGVWKPPLAPEPVVTGVDVALSFDEKGYSTISSSSEKRIKRSIRHVQQKISKQRPSATGDLSPFRDDSSSLCSGDGGASGSGGAGGGSESSSVVSCPDPLPLKSEQQLDSESYKSDISDASDKDQLVENYGGIVNDPQMVASPSNEDAAGDDSGMILEDPGAVLIQSNFGNSLGGQQGWSSTFSSSVNADPATAATPTPGRQIKRSESVKTTSRENERSSFQELLRNYSPIHTSVIRTPDFSETFGVMLHVDRVQQKEQETQTSLPSDSGDEDYEILPKSCLFTAESADTRTRDSLAIIGKICNEQGMDKQNYKCNACGRPIGMIYGKARVCNFDGHSYCHECHENDECSIPARIIHNWDFKKYKVSKHAKIFLHQIEEEPLIDVRQMNVQLYSIVDEMNELQACVIATLLSTCTMLSLRRLPNTQILRTQLSYLRSYLFTCRESVAEEMRRKLWPREYLYEHIHLYSFSDLLAIPTRSLAQLLSKVITNAVRHVQECRLCSQKGFICEICNNPNVIYPFELDTTHRCETCLAVYHKSCMNDAKPCPKCKRRMRRLSMDNIDGDDDDDFAWDRDVA